MLARVKRARFRPDARVIVVSDIHGNLPVFLRLMDMARYNPDEDTLVIVGDIVQRKPHSIATLRHVMELDKRDGVFVLIGNNDQFILDLMFGEGTEQTFLQRAQLPKTNMIGEMCVAAGIKAHDGMDMAAARRILAEAFRDELAYLAALPHILDTPYSTFVHAGLTTQNLDEHDAYLAIKNDAFYDQGARFQKPVVVGHWPTILCQRVIPGNNPVIDLDRNLICIDGGNAVKGESGQLNAILLDKPDFTRIDQLHCDELPEIMVQNDQAERPSTLCIVWGDNEVERISQGEEFSLCRHVRTGKAIPIPNDWIRPQKDGLIALDCSDYYLPVRAGERVKLIKTYSDRYLAKKDGVIGWIEGRPRHDTLS